jgi:hypothetical protein
VMFQSKSQRVGGSRHEVLQRLAARKPDELRRRKPRVEQLRILGPGFLMGLELPSPLIDVHQRIECAR